MPRTHTIAASLLGALLLTVLVVAAQEAPPTPDDAKTNGAAPKEEAQIRFQFDGVSYEDVIRRFAQMAGKPILGPVNVKGTLTFSDPRPYTYAEALDTLNYILALEGVVLAESGRYLRVVPKENVPSLPIEIFRGVESAEGVRPSEVVTVVVPVSHIDAEEAAKAASPLLSGAGSMTALRQGRGLVITDRMDVIRRIETLVGEMDVRTEATRELRTVQLRSDSGRVLAQMIEKTLGKDTAPVQSIFANNKWNTAPPNPADYVTVTYDAPTRTLVLFGPPESLRLAEKLIEEFESRGEGAGEVKIFYPRSVAPEELARMIREAIPGVEDDRPGRRRGGGEGESAEASPGNGARLLVDGRGKRLIVVAPVPATLRSIEEFVARIDGASGGEGPAAESRSVTITRVFRLERADPASLAEAIREATSHRDEIDGRVVERLRVAVDQPSKSIIVAGSPGDVLSAEAIVAEVDAAPKDETRETRSLAVADAAAIDSTARLLESLYREELGADHALGPADATIVIDKPRARLLVTGRSEHIDRIASLLEKVEGTTIRPVRELRVIPLTHADAADVTSRLDDLISKGAVAGIQPGDRPLVLADAPRRRLLVTASREEFEALRSVIAELDLAPAPATSVRAFSLVHRTPEEAKPLLESMLESDGGGPAPRLIVDNAGRRLVAIGSASALDRVEKALGVVDVSPLGAPSERETRVIALEREDASEILPLVERLYQAQLAGRPEPHGGPASLAASPDGRRLLVTATPAEIERVSAIVTTLVGEPGEKLERTTVVITPNVSDPAALLTLVEAVYSAQLEGGGEPAGGRAALQISDDGARFVITGPASEIERVREIVSTLDRERPDDGPQETRIVRMQVASAEEIASLVGRAVNGTGTRERVRVEIDPASNSLILSGEPSSVDAAASIAKELDVLPDRAPRELRVFEMRRGNARQTATLVEEHLRTTLAERRGAAYRSRARITPDESSNRLIVTAPKEELEIIDAFMAELTADESRQQSVKVLRLESRSAQRVASSLSDILREGGRGRRGDFFVRVSAVGDDRLMVSGSTEDIDMVESLVREIDLSSSTVPLDVLVVATAPRSGDDIADLAEDAWEASHGSGVASRVRFVASRAGDRVAVVGPKEIVGEARDLVESLRATEDETERTVATIPLEHRRADDVVDVLRRLWFEQRGDREERRPLVSAHPDGNAILVVATSAQHAMLRELAVRLDTPGERREQRTFSFASRDERDRIASAAERLWRETAASNDSIDGRQTEFLSSPVSSDLIVFSPPADLERVTEIITTLQSRVEPRPTRETRTYTFASNAERERLLDLAQPLYRDRWSSASPDNRAEATFLEDPDRPKLIVTAPVPELEVFETVLEELRAQDEAELPREAPELRIFELGSGEARSTASFVEEVLSERLRAEKGATYEPAARIVPDDEANRLIVTAPPAELSIIDEIVASLEEKPGEQGDARVFTLRNADPERVAQIVREAFVSQGPRGRPIYRVSVSADSSAGRLVVGGAPLDLQAVATVIEQLDQPAAGSEGVPRVIDLDHSNADQLARMANDLLAARYPQHDVEKSRVWGAPGARRVIVIAPERIVDSVVRDVKELDTLTKAKARKLHKIELEKGAADQVSAELLRVWAETTEPTEAEAISIRPDASNQRLVVIGTDAEVERVRTLLPEVYELIAKPPRLTSFFEIGGPEELARVKALVESLHRQSRSDRGLSVHASILEDTATGRMIVTAPSDELEEIAALVETARAPAASEPLETRVFDLASARAEELAATVAEIFRSETKDRPASARNVLILPDEATNRLVLRAPATDLATLEAIVKKLDDATPSRTTTRIIELENGSATSVSAAISELFRHRIEADRDSERLAVSVLGDDRTLILSGSEPILASVASLAQELDRPGASGRVRVRAYQLEASRAEEIAPRLENLFEAEEERGRGPVPRFEADTKTNRLLVAAREDRFEEIEDLLESLQAPAALASEIRTFPLASGDATEVVEVLQSVLGAESSDEGWWRRSRSSSTDTVRVAAASALNAVVVRGPPAELARAARVIEQLTGSATSRVLRTVKLTKASAVQLAQSLSEVFGDGGAARRSRWWDSPPASTSSRVKITAETQSNSLLIEGPESEVEEVLRLVRELDVEAPAGGVQLRIYRLENGRAREVSRAIEPLIREILSNEARAGDRRGPPEPFSLSVDEKDNRLIVYGNSRHLSLVEGLIEAFDQPPEPVDRVVEFVTLKNFDVVTAAIEARALFSDLPFSERPSIESDSLASSITIIGRKSDVARARSFLESVDQSAAKDEDQVRVVPLMDLPVVQAAQMLVDLYSTLSDTELVLVGDVPTNMKKEGARAPGAASSNAPGAEGSSDGARGADDARDRGSGEGARPANGAGRTSGDANGSGGSGVPPPRPRATDPGAEPSASSSPPGAPLSPASPVSPLEGETADEGTTASAEPSDAAKKRVVISVHRSSNALVLSGPGRELDRIVRLIDELSFNFIVGDAEFRIFHLQAADPVKTVEILEGLFNPRQSERPRQGEERGALPPPKISAVADPRARSVIVRAKPTDFVLIEEIVAQLDSLGTDARIEYRRYTLEHATPEVAQRMLEQLIEQLRAVQPGDQITVLADPRTRGLIVAARPALFSEIDDMVSRIDSPSDFASADVVLVPLKLASAASLAPVLQAMLRPADDGTVTPEARALQEQIRRLRIRDGNGDLVELDLRQPIKIMADSLSGAGGGNRIIVSSTPSNVIALEAVVKLFDTVPVAEGLSVRLVRLERANAETVSDVIEEIFEQSSELARSPAGQGEPANPSGRALVRPLHVAVDRRTNTLILSGEPATVALAIGVIEDMDREIEPFESVVRVFRLEHGVAVRIAPLLQSVFLDASPQVPGSEGLSTQVTRLRTILPGLEEQATTFPKARVALVVTADPTTNTIIAVARSDVMPLIADVIRTMDLPSAAELPVRIIPLDHARAVELEPTIRGMFSGPTASLRAPGDLPVVASDARTNSLVIAASDKTFAMVESLVKTIDRPTDLGVELRIFPLKHNDATVLAGTLTQFFAARRQSLAIQGLSDTESRVDLQADRLTNSLIASGTKENLDLVERLLARVDVEPSVEGTVLELFSLQYADAQRAAGMLRSLVEQGIYRPGLLSRAGGPSARDRIAVGVDTRTNTLFVSASPENLQVVRELVGRLDQPGLSDHAGVRVYMLQNAPASEVAQTLQSFFQSRRASEGAVSPGERVAPVYVIADTRTNSLLVTGSPESFRMLDDMVPKLDSIDRPYGAEFRVFSLKSATAAKLAGTIRQLMTSRPARPGEPPNQPVGIVEDTWTNSLLVTALPDDMSLVSSLVDQLDSQAEAPGMELQVIPLSKADAASVANTFNSLYRSTTTAGATSPVAVSVDTRLNALVIAASPAERKRVEELVRKLDTGLVSRVNEIRIVPLRHADAVSLATIISQSLLPAATGAGAGARRQLLLQFAAHTEEGEELVSSAIQDEISIIPDPRTNSLVISAPVENIPLLEQVVRELDTHAPQIAQIRVFQLQNADARQMATLLSEMFRLQATGGAEARSIRYELATRDPLEAGPVAPVDAGGAAATGATLGSAERASLTVSVDVRTNSILLGGTEHYVELASEIIQELDSSPAREMRTRVYRLKNAQAAEIQTALASFLEQRRQRLAETLGSEALGAAQRQLEDTVAIVAETASNSLLLSASPRTFDEIAELIEDLDQPQPQVLIQALLAEVTLDDALDLGTEWNLASELDGTPYETGTDFGVPLDLTAAGGFFATVTGGEVSFLIRALEADGRLEVLSRPQILAADNMRAEINIGQRVPQVTGSVTTELGNINNTIEYREVGVILRVTPRIGPDGFVTMEVEPEISSLSQSSVDFGTGVSAPVFNERRAVTTVSVQNGHTIVIGGLISTTDDVREEGIPILKDIPLLGYLFKSRKLTKVRTELLIILTPHVITGVEHADWITDETVRASGFAGRPGRDAMQENLLRELERPSRPRDLPGDENAIYGPPIDGGRRKED